MAPRYTKLYDEKRKLHCSNGPALYADDGSAKEWYRHGIRHREDGPAVIKTNSKGEHKQLWYNNGILSRIDGPAVIIDRQVHGKTVRREEWFLDGRKHREDGPAVTDTMPRCGLINEWWHHGELHRDGGPAITRDVGHNHEEEWYHHGQLHREDGPAAMYIEKEYSDILTCSEHWYINGELHREAGPAVTTYTSCTGDKSDRRVVTEQWYCHGKRHCTTGPAFIRYEHGCPYAHSWYQDDAYHREDGPASYKVGSEQDGKWFIRGVELVSYDQWCKLADENKQTGIIAAKAKKALGGLSEKAREAKERELELAMAAVARLKAELEAMPWPQGGTIE